MYELNTKHAYFRVLIFYINSFIYRFLFGSISILHLKMLYTAKIKCYNKCGNILCRACIYGSRKNKGASHGRNYAQQRGGLEPNRNP